jgi:hypothetical protein
MASGRVGSDLVVRTNSVAAQAGGNSQQVDLLDQHESFQAARRPVAVAFWRGDFVQTRAPGYASVPCGP